MKAKTNIEIRDYLKNLAESPTPNSPDDNGYRQVNRHMSKVYSDLCRVDAVGKMSRRDIVKVDREIDLLKESGVFGQDWNGYLTIIR